MSVTSCQVPCCYRPEKELLMTATKPIAMSAEQVRSIALETGVTEAQIRMIEARADRRSDLQPTPEGDVCCQDRTVRAF
jgi:hypothetical protein